MTPIDKYMEAMNLEAISLVTSIVSVNLVAIEALKKIKSCPVDHKEYERCQEIIDKQATKLYLPLSSDGRSVAGGLMSLLNPALNQAPSLIIGEKLVNVYVGAINDNPFPINIMTHRWKNHRYLPCKRFARNPYLEKNPTAWKFRFSDKNLTRITIEHNNLYLITEQEKYKISVDNKKDTWEWFIQSTPKNQVVHLFKLNYLMKPYLSTTAGWKCAERGGNNSKAHWKLT